uniref:Glyco_trans_2-like domain-containing protein n=1 Tax=Strongyloides papillosus TaxID=174720 RepID=A0A0N5B5B3_STREA
MERDHSIFHGETFADSVKDYYRRREKAQRKRKQYKYWIFIIGVLGIIYFLMTSIKIFQKETSLSKVDIKKFVNKTNSNFHTTHKCQKCFIQKNQSDVLGKNKDYRNTINELCKWSDQNMTIESPEFPVSIIYKTTDNRVILDIILNLMYHPKHFYCIIIDNKNISESRRNDILKMSECLPNIFVTDKRDNIRGHGLECLDVLVNYKWNYTILLNENDIPIKNIDEIIEDLKPLDGMSDVPIYSIFPENTFNSSKFTYDIIDIFNNKDLILRNKHLQKKKLVITRTAVSITLSRDDVDYYYKYINRDNYIRFISRYSIMKRNNVFWPTLLSNEELNFPSHTIKSQKNISTNIGLSSFMKYKLNIFYNRT